MLSRRNSVSTVTKPWRASRPQASASVLVLVIGSIARLDSVRRSLCQAGFQAAHLLRSSRPRLSLTARTRLIAKCLMTALFFAPWPVLRRDWASTRPGRCLYPARQALQARQGWQRGGRPQLETLLAEGVRFFAERGKGLSRSVMRSNEGPALPRFLPATKARGEHPRVPQIRCRLVGPCRRRY